MVDSDDSNYLDEEIEEECPDCGETFEDLNKLVSHYDNVHQKKKSSVNEPRVNSGIQTSTLKDESKSQIEIATIKVTETVSFENLLARNIQLNNLPLMPRFSNKSGGNSWYEAISDQIILHDIPFASKDHASIRKAVCDALLTLSEAKAWVKNLFGGKKKEYLAFVEKHRQDGEYPDAKGLICQATALLLRRTIHIVGTVNMTQKVHYTKLESVSGADKMPPLNIGYFSDNYQSLEKIHVGETVKEIKTDQINNESVTNKIVGKDPRVPITSRPLRKKRVAPSREDNHQIKPKPSAPSVSHLPVTPQPRNLQPVHPKPVIPQAYNDQKITSINPQPYNGRRMKTKPIVLSTTPLKNSPSMSSLLSVNINPNNVSQIIPKQNLPPAIQRKLTHFKIARNVPGKNALPQNEDTISNKKESTNMKPVSNAESTQRRTKTIKKLATAPPKVNSQKVEKPSQMSVIARRKLTNDAAVKIQRWFRHTQRGRVDRKNFLKKKQAAQKIQSVWKSSFHRRVAIKTKAVRTLQNKLRTFSLRNTFIRKKSAASTIQKFYRKTRNGRVYRKEFLRKRKAATTLQRHWRRWLASCRAPSFQLVPQDQNCIDPETGGVQSVHTYMIHPQTGHMERVPIGLEEYVCKINGFLDFRKLSEMSVKSWKKLKTDTFLRQEPQLKEIIKIDSDLEDGVTEEPSKDFEISGQQTTETIIWKFPLEPLKYRNNIFGDATDDEDEDFDDNSVSLDIFSASATTDNLFDQKCDGTNVDLILGNIAPPSFRGSQFNDWRKDKNLQEQSSWLERNIEAKRNSIKINAAVTIQSFWRSFQYKKQFNKIKNAALKIQKWLRHIQIGRVTRQHYCDQKQAALTIQSYWRGMVARKNFEKIKMTNSVLNDMIDAPRNAAKDIIDKITSGMFSPNEIRVEEKKEKSSQLEEFLTRFPDKDPKNRKKIAGIKRSHETVVDNNTKKESSTKRKRKVNNKENVKLKRDPGELISITRVTKKAKVEPNPNEDVFILEEIIINPTNVKKICNKVGRKGGAKNTNDIIVNSKAMSQSNNNEITFSVSNKKPGAQSSKKDNSLPDVKTENISITKVPRPVRRCRLKTGFMRPPPHPLDFNLSEKPHEKMDKVPPCIKCDKICKDKNSLRTHFLSHYSDTFSDLIAKAKPFACTQRGCKNVARNKTGAIDHIAFTHRKLGEVTGLSDESMLLLCLK